jgi:hypothetical protein
VYPDSGDGRSAHMGTTKLSFLCVLFECYTDLVCIKHDNIRHLRPFPISVRALVMILQRFEHVKYLRYLMGPCMGLFGAVLLAENSLPWPLPVKCYNRLDIPYEGFTK